MACEREEKEARQTHKKNNGPAITVNQAPSVAQRGLGRAARQGKAESVRTSLVNTLAGSWDGRNAHVQGGLSREAHEEGGRWRRRLTSGGESSGTQSRLIHRAVIGMRRSFGS